MQIKILIADEQHILVKKLFFRLQEDERIKVIAPSDSGSIFELIGQHQPDMVIYDFLKDHNGIPALKTIANSSVRAIALTDHMDYGTVSEFFCAGGWGYLLRISAEEEIAAAVRNVSRGELFLCPDLGGNLLRKIFSLSSQIDHSLLKRLSIRENDVLVEICKGNAIKEIAEHLNISTSTVEQHKKKIFEKLEVHRMIDLQRDTFFFERE